MILAAPDPVAAVAAVEQGEFAIGDNDRCLLLRRDVRRAGRHRLRRRRASSPTRSTTSRWPRSRPPAGRAAPGPPPSPRPARTSPPPSTRTRRSRGTSSEAAELFDGRGPAARCRAVRGSPGLSQSRRTVPSGELLAREEHRTRRPARLAARPASSDSHARGCSARWSTSARRPGRRPTGSRTRSRSTGPCRRTAHRLVRLAVPRGRVRRPSRRRSPAGRQGRRRRRCARVAPLRALVRPRPARRPRPPSRTTPASSSVCPPRCRPGEDQQLLRGAGSRSS